MILRTFNVLDGRDRSEIFTRREGLIQVAVLVELREAAVGSFARLYFRAFQLLAKVCPNVRVADIAGETSIAPIGM